MISSVPSTTHFFTPLLTLFLRITREASLLPVEFADRATVIRPTGHRDKERNRLPFGDLSLISYLSLPLHR